MNVKDFLGWGDGRKEGDQWSDTTLRDTRYGGGERQTVEIQGEKVGVDVPDGVDVDMERVMGEVDRDVRRHVVLAESNGGGSGVVNPVARPESSVLGGLFEGVNNDYDRIRDEKIKKLRSNRVNYNELVGEWIIDNDDRVPAILNNQMSLILGQEGLQVEAVDPDREADREAAEMFRRLYNSQDTSLDLPDVSPSNVIREILQQNYMAARSVLRSTDLAELPLDSLTYYRDPETATEYYLQSEMSYRKIDVDRDREGWSSRYISSGRKVLEVGENVFDAHLFNSKPLKSIADLVVNKMVLQRLMARKAEIASVGGLYIQVGPPEWLKENEYSDRVQDPDNEGEEIKKLELAMRREIANAFETLQDYQSGFIMSIPSHWEVNQIEVPETGEAMGEQIRTYNKSIAARLLFPLDLMELREGSELSRNTIFRTLLNTIAGWRREVLEVFDGFAEVTKDVYGVEGDVRHSFPPLENEDEKLIISALKNAGLAGLTTKEVRQILNNIEGIDLSESPPDSGPAPGGPQSRSGRKQSMKEMLDSSEDGGPGTDGGGGGEPKGQEIRKGGVGCGESGGVRDLPTDELFKQIWREQ